MKELLMGNEAVAVGALAAGVQCVSGYPGTPSTEVLETVAKKNPGGVYVEWSINEKAAMEVAAGAAYAGARALVTMKQVGLNVASDPLMCVNYIGVKGALVVYVADDPGPISSQTEQDTRHFGKYARIPVFDASSPEEAFELISEAFDFSEKHGVPVILRSTTRVCHSCAPIDVPKLRSPGNVSGFEKNPRWVIFPRLSCESKKRLVRQESEFADEFSGYGKNEIIGDGKIGIACGGVSFAYVMDAISGYESNFTVFKVATPYPFPRKTAERFLAAVDKVIVFEELDPVIEDALIYIHKGKIFGKRSGAVQVAGELSSLAVAKAVDSAFGTKLFTSQTCDNSPAVPFRPPALCPGCPHRASFYAVKRALHGKKAFFCGDIGCYTLGNAAPLDMVDTCLCMGAGITVAQGLNHVEKDSVNVSFIGDSTFFASGITGVINAVYNKAEQIIVVLDNSTTAMTGHQPHPGTGKTMMGDVSQAISIENVLRGIGIASVRTVDPLDLSASIEAVKSAASESGVRAIIFKSPCVAIIKSEKSFSVADSCIGCRKCINDLGCPALGFDGRHAVIDPALCTGCELCAQVCPVKCISREGN